MAEALVVVAHIVDVIDQLRADNAVPPHCKCGMGAAVLENGSRVLCGIWPVAEYDHAARRPRDVARVVADSAAYLATKALLGSNVKEAGRTKAAICAQNGPGTSDGIARSAVPKAA